MFVKDLSYFKIKAWSLDVFIDNSNVLRLNNVGELPKDHSQRFGFEVKLQYLSTG